jgi:hypothetical protein
LHHCSSLISGDMSMQWQLWFLKSYLV